MTQKNKNLSNARQSESRISSVTGQVRSGLSSVGKTASSHKTLGLVIGAGAALAAYFASEHGRSTLSTIRSGMSTGWSRFRDFASSQLEGMETSGSETQGVEGFHITEFSQQERPRRVV